ncbi:MAG: GWxTD domain-containing protein [Bacteroidetes bacterium]|nr:GWxTD domain-containing protein [Bacteroidota bacterium]
MKKIAIVLALFSFSMLQTHGKHLNALFSYCTFDQPGKSPYIETYIDVLGNSAVFTQNAGQKWQGKIEVQWTYKQHDKVVYFDKYNLLSPEVSDSNLAFPDFIDQQRVQLPNGDYVLELKITDKHSAEQSYLSTENISINYSPSQPSISDIEFLESFKPAEQAGSFTKSGYDVIPYVNNYFPKNSGSLKFYAEIYHTKDVAGDEDILVTYAISGHQNKKVINNIAGFKKQKASSVSSLIAELPMEDVSSGNYYLEIEVRDKTNKLLASKNKFFQRSKPMEKELNADDLSTIKIDNTFVSYMTNKDTLSDYISSLYPISAQFEVTVEENQMKFNNLESMQQFFYYFWSKRSAQNPEQAWLNYKTEVDKVNADFKCVSGKGYESDRGRIYLQYGEPNSIDKNYYEGAAYPYEIWHYYKTMDQSNVKFVFMSRNLTNNCFELIHSTARGEFYDANWQMRLISESKSNSMFGNIDRGDDYSHDGNSNGNLKSKAKEDFITPH